MNFMDNIETIFIDLDGPILDGKYKHYKCYADIINKYGGKPIDIESYWNMKRSKIKRTILLEMSNFQSDYSTFYEEWLENIEKVQYLELDVIKPFAKETLNQWKKVVNNIILVTMRQNRENLIYQLGKLNILNVFNEIITCSPLITNSKYEALKGKDFGNAVFIGDTEEDMNTAKALNITSIAVTNGLRQKEFLSANIYVEEIKDLI